MAVPGKIGVGIIQLHMNSVQQIPPRVAYRYHRLSVLIGHDGRERGLSGQMKHIDALLCQRRTLPKKLNRQGVLPRRQGIGRGKGDQLDRQTKLLVCFIGARRTDLDQRFGIAAVPFGKAGLGQSGRKVRRHRPIIAFISDIGVEQFPIIEFQPVGGGGIGQSVKPLGQARQLSCREVADGAVDVMRARRAGDGKALKTTGQEWEGAARIILSDLQMSFNRFAGGQDMLYGVEPEFMGGGSDRAAHPQGK